MTSRRSEKWEVGSGNDNSHFRIPHSALGRGFTLTEAMVVVVILGTLMAVGIPSYTRTVERNYRQQAQDVLMSIYAGERSYFHTQNAYYGPLDASSTMAAWRTIQMDDPNLGAVPVTFAVSASGSTFTATATRTSGSCSGQTLTIDQTRTIAGGWLTCAP